MVKELAKTLSIEYKEARIRCVGHIINLVVKSILFRDQLTELEKELLGASDDACFKAWNKIGVIGKLHNICVWINRTDQRRQRFFEGQTGAQNDLDEDCDEEDDKIFYYQLLVDGGVRWNSAYYMIKRALQLRPAIEYFFFRYEDPSDKSNEYNLQADALTDQDWKELEALIKLLQPFKRLTKHMEGVANKFGQEGSHGAIWETLKSMDYMFSHLKQSADAIAADPVQYPQSYAIRVDAGFLKLRKYYKLTDETAIYRAAMVLHPKYKFDYFEENWQDQKRSITECRTAVRKLYQRYEDNWQDAEDQADDIIESTQESLSEDEFEAFGTVSGNSNRRKRRKIDDQLDQYTDSGVSEKDKKVKDPLQWWITKGSKWPILQQMAFDIFSIPAMSAECERVFSQAKRFVTDERNRVSNATVEADQCLKNWLLQGIF